MPRGNINNLLKVKKGERPGGRQKGTPNKVTTSMKEAVLLAFNKMGGAEALCEWGKKPVNKKAFYSIAARLIPTELVGAGGSNLLGASEVHVYMPDNGRAVPEEEQK